MTPIWPGFVRLRQVLLPAGRAAQALPSGFDREPMKFTVAAVIWLPKGLFGLFGSEWLKNVPVMSNVSPVTVKFITTLYQKSGPVLLLFTVAAV